MVSISEKLVLWTGEKHSGKTTSAANLVKIARGEGFNVAGLLAPSIYSNGELLGFDAVDLKNENRTPLARRQAEQFTFFDSGLKFGNVALSIRATKSADLVIVDEFGPLELDGQGWRKDVDLLLASSNALILLVVRQELDEEVRRIYEDIPCRILDAIKAESVCEVIGMLKNNRQLQRETA